MKTKVQPTPAPTPAQTPANDAATQLLAELEGGVQKIREKTLADFRAAFGAQLAEALTPDRSDVEAIAPNGGPAPRKRERASGIRVTPSEELLYRTLPTAEREFRKPETDHWIAEWLRGMATKDHARFGRANDELFALERADTLEGTTTAGSGLSGGTGGALIPLPFSTLIVRARDKKAKIRQLAQRYTSDSLTLRVPVETVATAAMASEGAVAAAGEPTFSAILFHKKKMQANFEASDEMLADSAFNLVSLYSERAGSAFAALEDVQLCTSNGTAPNITSSLGSAAISDVSEAVAGTLGYADVVKLFYALPEQYQGDAVFFADSTVLEILSKIRTSGGMPILGSQLGPANVLGDAGMRGVVGTLFGRPVFNVPVTAGGLFVGDPSFLGILDGGGITVKTTDAALWSADSTAFRFTTRFDGAVMLADAFRKMIGLTTAGT